MVFAHKRTTTPRPQTRRNLYPQYQRKSYGWGTAYLRYGTCLADAKTGLAVDRGIHLAQKNCDEGKWPNRFRDAWERLLQFNKSKKFKMYQEAVMVPIGDWSKTRLKNLSETDKQRDNSRVGSGFGKNISNWLGKDLVYPSNVLHLATESSNKNHSATFPLSLPSWFIKLFTETDDLVLDPFLGSGTTLISASLLGRNSIGIEILQEYYDIAIERFHEETSKKQSVTVGKLTRIEENFSENQLSLLYG